MKEFCNSIAGKHWPKIYGFGLTCDDAVTYGKSLAICELGFRFVEYFSDQAERARTFFRPFIWSEE